MTRVALMLLLVACGDASEDDAPTCVSTRTDEFREDRTVATMRAPGKPTVLRTFLDGAELSRWDFTYDDAGRIVMIEQDAGLDGVLDLRTRYEHTATRTVERHFSPALDHDEEIVHAIDPHDRVIRSQGPTYIHTFELAADGRIERSVGDGLDEAGMRQTTEITYRYENGWLVEEAVTDSQRGPFPPTTYAYEAHPHRLTVTTGTLAFTYTYDDEGRTVRVEKPTEGLVVDLAYADDGAVEITWKRDGEVGRTETLSNACGFRPRLPDVPRGQPRPGLTWFINAASLPSPY